jgi:hypothetical protein
MCFGVQLHYNLTLLKAYTLKAGLEKLQTPSVTLLNWNIQNHRAYSFLGDSIRATFYAQWMQVSETDVEFGSGTLL